MLPIKLSRYILLSSLITCQNTCGIMAWRSHGKDNTDMVRHLKGITFYIYIKAFV